VTFSHLTHKPYSAPVNLRSLYKSPPNLPFRAVPYHTHLPPSYPNRKHHPIEAHTYSRRSLHPTSYVRYVRHTLSPCLSGLSITTHSTRT